MTQYLDYSPDLSVVCDFRGTTIDLNHPLSLALLKVGGKPKGNDSPFAWTSPNGISGVITYNARRMFTESGHFVVWEDKTLLDVFLSTLTTGKVHPFFESVGLPWGPPLLWGAAAVVNYMNSLLQGLKEMKTEGIDAVWGGKWSLPSGIVGIEDLRGRSLREGLLLAILRELKEEAGVVLPDFVVEQVVLTPRIEVARVKTQMFGVFKPTELPEIKSGEELKFGTVGFYAVNAEVLFAYNNFI